MAIVSMPTKGINHTTPKGERELTVVAASGVLDDLTPWMAARRMTMCAGSNPAGGATGTAAGATAGAGGSAAVAVVAAVAAVGRVVVVVVGAAAPRALLTSERRRQEPSPTVCV